MTIHSQHSSLLVRMPSPKELRALSRPELQALCKASSLQPVPLRYAKLIPWTVIQAEGIKPANGKTSVLIDKLIAHFANRAVTPPPPCVHSQSTVRLIVALTRISVQHDGPLR